MPRPRRDGARARAARRFNLTQRMVDRIRAEPLPFTVWDKRACGLCLRVYPSGRRVWYVVYRSRGRPEWFHLGDAALIPLADARRKRAHVAVMVLDGRDPVAERRAARVGTFAEVHERYVREHASRHNKSWKQADALVRRFLLPRWGRLSPSAITRADVRAMVSSIAAPITANATLAAASAIFTWAVSMEIASTNPCRGVEGNPTTSRSRVLSDDEIKKFWRAFDTAGLVRGAALRLILLLGQRPGETRRMRREHVNQDGWWTLPGAADATTGWPGTKNHSDHRVFLSPPARAIIDELSNGETTGFVFASERGRPVGGLDHAMRRICADIGAERATPHDLRRTFGTTVTGLGLGRQCMDRLLNHADHSIGSVYDRHAYRREDQAAWERVAGHIMSLVDDRVAGDNVVQFAPPA